MSCLIGISAGWWAEKSLHRLHDEYVQAVIGAGGTPLILPCLGEKEAAEVYALCDGFILSGGDDVDSYWYGEEPQQTLGLVAPQRDIYELALARLILQGQKPLLAICRGLQVLNVSAGGSLYQEIKDVTTQLHVQDAPRWYPIHQVDLQASSRMAKTLGCQSLRVNSFHHQGLKKVGSLLTAVGKTSDGLVEAVEAKDPSQFIWGVQWHPECSWDKDPYALKLFKELVKEAKKRKD